MFITVKDAAQKWAISEQLVRRYLRQNRIPGAVMDGQSWLIPMDAKKPANASRENIPLPPLAAKLVKQRNKRVRNGIYAYVQINLTYSNNRMASNRLERQQVEDLFRKDKIATAFEPLKYADIIEAVNHFIAVDFMLDNVNSKLTQTFIKKLHYLLKYASYEDRKQLEVPGEYRPRKKTPKFFPVTPAEKITEEMNALLSRYEALPSVTLDELLDFHVKFEKIHPFADANGRVGRLILFKECLRHDITPFILDDKRRTGYLKGLREWDENDTALQVVCREAQERFARQLELQGLLETQTYFR